MDLVVWMYSEEMEGLSRGYLPKSGWKDIYHGDPSGDGMIASLGMLFGSLGGVVRVEGSLSWGSVRGGWKDLSRGDLSKSG